MSLSGSEVLGFATTEPDTAKWKISKHFLHVSPAKTHYSFLKCLNLEMSEKNRKDKIPKNKSKTT